MPVDWSLGFLVSGTVGDADARVLEQPGGFGDAPPGHMAVRVAYHIDSYVGSCNCVAAELTSSKFFCLAGPFSGPPYTVDVRDAASWLHVF